MPGPSGPTPANEDSLSTVCWLGLGVTGRAPISDNKGLGINYYYYVATIFLMYFFFIFLLPPSFRVSLTLKNLSQRITYYSCEEEEKEEEILQVL